MYFERVCKKVSSWTRSKEYEGTGISVWLNKLSRCKFKREGCCPRAFECGGKQLKPACWWYGIAWYALVLCCVVYHAIAMVCHALLWYGVLKPVSRWGQCPPAGILWREICSGCSQRLYSCTAPVHAARPYCSLSRRHRLGWSNLFFVNKFLLHFVPS